MSTIRNKAIAGLRVGDRFSVSRTFSEQDTQCFGDLTGDYNPVHYDPRFARAKDFRARICHGLLAGSLVCEIGGQIGWLASGMGFRFRKPVYFGDRITCMLTITDLDRSGRAKAKAICVNQHGEVVIEATLSGIVPGKKEREILRTMVAEGDPTNPRAED